MLDKDWLNHPTIRQLTTEARGVLADLVILSKARGEQQDGIITDSDLPLTVKEIAKRCHTDIRTLRSALPALKQAGLLRESPKGLYLPCIVRAANRHQQRVENGRLGGNPLLQRSPEACPKPKKSYFHNLSHQVQKERTQFAQFWSAYPKEQRGPGIPARAAFHMHYFHQREGDFMLLMDHLLNRTDPTVGDITWQRHPEKIPDAATFLKKQLWKQEYCPALEVS